MSGGKIYDVIVVGAGIEGSATAYYLSKQGKTTLLLEQVFRFFSQHVPVSNIFCLRVRASAFA